MRINCHKYHKTASGSFTAVDQSSSSMSLFSGPHTLNLGYCYLFFTMLKYALVAHCKVFVETPCTTWKGTNFTTSTVVSHIFIKILAISFSFCATHSENYWTIHGWYRSIYNEIDRVLLSCWRYLLEGSFIAELKKSLLVKHKLYWDWTVRFISDLGNTFSSFHLGEDMVLSLSWRH